MLYFEVGSSTKAVSYCRPDQTYQATWFNPRTGEWMPLPTLLAADADGVIYLPPSPGGDNEQRFSEDWALQLRVS